MLAQSLFPHKDLQNLKGFEMQDKMMLEKGVNWNNLETRYKRGTYVKRVVSNKPFTVEEISELPEKHKARQNPNLIIERSVISVVEYPIFNTIKNKVGVIFNNEEPIIDSDTQTSKS